MSTVPPPDNPSSQTVAYAPPAEVPADGGTLSIHPQRDNMADAATLPPSPSPPATLAGRPTVPGYEILGELGRGGMGVVYQARHLKLKRLVALKMILAGGHAGAEELARFRREAEAVAALQHPNVVQVYEVGEQDGRPYFALEFVAGGSLAGKLDGTPWPAPRAAELIERLARAMHSAHERGVVHRDLKPGNVLLADDGAPKITDFGLAKQIGEQGHTQSGSILGTPSYMAPEQAEGRRDIGPAADVYALGAILYELVTGRPPFRAETPLDTVLQVVSNDPVPPTRLQPKLPRDLETIALKCLQKAPAKRYASAAALADDLRRFLDGQPITARPVSRRERLVKWAKRRPAVAALTLLSAFVTVLGLVLVTWQWREATTARRRAEDALQDARTNLYVNHIALAEREWRAGNVDRAETLLDACPVTHRGWEWHYLKRLNHSDLLTLPASSNLVNFGTVAVSPDGTRLAAAGEGHTVRVWEIASGAAVQTLRGHNGPVAAVAFSPDGRRLASGSVDPLIGRRPTGQTPDRIGEVLVWGLGTGQVSFTGRGHRGGVRSLAFSPDSRHLASAGGDPYDRQPGEVTVWDVAAGREVRSMAGPPGAVNGLAYRPDGGRLAAAGVSYQTGPGEVKIWESATGAEQPPFRGHERSVYGLAFSPDGRRLATASLDQTVKVWDVASRAPLSTLRGHAAITAVRFSPDGRRLASAGLDKVLRVWDGATGQEVQTFRGHTGPLGALEYSPDGRLLVTAGLSARETQVKPDPAPDFVHRGVTAGLSAHGTEVKVWDTAAGQEALSQQVHFGQALSLAVDVGGRHLATAGYDGAVRVWDAATLRAVRSFQGPPGEANAAGLSPDGRLVAARGAGPELKVWEVATGKEVLALPGFDGSLRGVAFSPDGQFLVTTRGHPLNSDPGEVTVWELAARRAVHNWRGLSAAFSPDGRLLAVGGLGGRLTVWNLAAGREAHALAGLGGPVMRVAFSRDGRRLAAAASLTVQVWDVATGQHLTSFWGMKAHNGDVRHVAFSPDGRRLVSASLGLAQWGQGEVKVWDLNTGGDVFTLPANAAAVFGPDGHWLAAFETDLFLPSRLKLFDARAATPEAQATRRGAVRQTTPAWHRDAADECINAQQWVAAVFHLDRALAAQPGDGRLFERRGFAHAALAQWGEAATDYERAIERGVPGRIVWYRRALVDLARDDRDGYRRHCAQVLERFGQATEPETAVTVPWVCKLAPDAVADYAAAVRCAERAAAANPKNVEYLNHLGGILLRAGRPEEAVQRLEEAQKLRRDGSGVWEWIWLALAHQRLGHVTEARQWLDRAVRWIDEFAPEGPGADERLTWDARLELRLLRREAEAALK